MRGNTLSYRRWNRLSKKGNKGKKAWRFPVVLAVLAFIVAICGTLAMEIDPEKKDETNHEEGLR